MELELTRKLVGSEFLINDSMATNFSAVYSNMTDSMYRATLTYSDETFYGKAIKVDKAILVFFEKSLALPSGMCITLEEIVAQSKDKCQTVEMTLTSDTRIAVIGDDGCVAGWVKLGTITEQPKNLCELYGYPRGIPEGKLTSSDRLLVVDGDCGLKSVPVSDLTCNPPQGGATGYIPRDKP